MSQVLASGIDVGNLVTLSAVFQTNESDPMKSVPVKVADRNGMKEPSSEIYFDNGNRLTATAAKVLSDRNPSACIKFVKSSIKRPFEDISDQIKKIVTSLSPDENGEAQYVISIDGKNTAFWPSHMAGIYISDRIADIKKERKVDNLCLVLSVPNYYTDEQVEDFQAGLSVGQVDNYILIKEVDSMAVDYSYYKSLYHEFDTKPIVVLFIGVGFGESQAYAIEFSKDAYHVMSYAHTNQVCSSKVDTLLYELFYDTYDENRDEDDDPDIRENSVLSAKLLNTIINTKHQMSDQTLESIEVMIPDYNECGDDFFMEISTASLREKIEDSGMLDNLKQMINDCIEGMNGVVPDRLEIMDNGVLTVAFRDTVNETCSEHGIEISKNTHDFDSSHITSECIVNGNTKYAFYASHYGDPFYQQVISPLCDSVKPVTVCSPFVTAPALNAMNHSVEFSEKALMKIENAQGVEGQSKKRQQQAKRHKALLNQFQEFIQDTKHRIEDTSVDVSNNMYALNEPMLQELMAKWNRWFQENEKHDVEELEKKLVEIKEEREKVQKEFTVMYRERCAAEAEEERKRQEERARQAEIERIKLMEEKERQEKEAIALWKTLCEDSYNLVKWLTSNDYVVLKVLPVPVTDPRFHWGTLPPFLQDILQPLRHLGDYPERARYPELEIRGSPLPNLGDYRERARYPELEIHGSPLPNLGDYRERARYPELQIHGSPFPQQPRDVNPNTPRHGGVLPFRIHKNREGDISFDRPYGQMHGALPFRNRLYGDGLPDNMAYEPSLSPGLSMTNLPVDIKFPFNVPVSMSPVQAPISSYAFSEENGIVEIAKGKVYKGTLIDGIPNGEGILIDCSVNETIYDGLWHDGFYHGMGTLFVQGEQVAHGEFDHGKLVKGSRHYKDGSFFVGEFQNGVPNGLGRLILPSGIIVEGQWKDFKPIGEMIYHFPGYQPIHYDMEKADDITRWSIFFSDSAIVLLDTHFASGNISFIFYLNGDVFIGTTKQQILPFNGDYYKYCGKHYLKMRCGNESLGVRIKGIELKSSSSFRYKCINYIL